MTSTPVYYSNGDVVRDEKVDNNDGPTYDNEDVIGHRVELWLHGGVGEIQKPTNVDYVDDEKEKRRRKRRHKKSSLRNSLESYDDGRRRRSVSGAAASVVSENKQIEEGQSSVAPPGERVKFLLSHEDDIDGSSIESHSIFSEMVEWNDAEGLQEWKETARWVKFEEDVEEGGNRWSKPHVATLSLHSLFELRSCLMVGMVILDLDATQITQIVDTLMDTMLTSKAVDNVDTASKIRDILLRKHKHQYEQHKLDLIKTVRSFADIGRQFSTSRNMHTAANDSGILSANSTVASNLNAEKSHFLSAISPVPNVLSVPKDMVRGDSSNSSESSLKGNLHFFKKLPSGAEAANILIGQLEFLDRPISAFVRLRHAIILGDLTEVPLPTRFLFIIIGPIGHGNQYREIGRALATLMSDEVFHDVAYKAHNRNDLLDGVDEFLDQVTVLPPGEWDPSIRIEPPSSIPSQDKRKQSSNNKGTNGTTNETSKKDDESEEVEENGGHVVDSTLKRTGCLFGGLVADIKRKIPFFMSDFKDAFNLQCVAAFMYMYFAMLAPIVTFGGLLEEATDKRMAAIENLLSGAICGTMYALFAGQPLTMIGSTGPVLVFEKIIFELCEQNQWDFLAFRWWINVWSGVILLIMVATDASALVSYITRFTEENFAVLISFIFVYESFAKTIKIMNAAHTIPFDKNLAPNPYCVCKEKTEFVDYSIPTLKDYSFVLTNASKYKWKGNVSSYTFFDASRNVTSVVWDRVPLTYCKASGGQLETLSSSSTNQCYEMLDVFLLSIGLTIGTFALAYFLKTMRNSGYFPAKVRQIFSDFAVIIALTSMVLVDHFFDLDTPKLYVPDKFQPTWPERKWLVEPFGENPVWSSIVALPPAILLCILLFMDHQITIVIVNRKENKLKKGCGYHLDLFLLSIGVVITGVLGLPIFVAATVMSISHVNSLRVESECRAPGEKPMFVGVREQRVTGFLVYTFIGLSVFMTDLLKHIPMPVLYGVFLYMGISSLAGVQMIDRLCLLFMPMKYQPDYVYLRHVPVKRVHLFTVFQLGCFVILCLIKEIQQTSIVFPLMLVVTVAVRKLMEYVFTERELKYLDDKMPEIIVRKHEDAKKKRDSLIQESQKAPSQPRSGRRPTIEAIQSEENLHITLTSGNVIKIPLTSISEKQRDVEPVMNLSQELTKSGVWKHIASESSFGSKDGMNSLANKSKSKTSSATKLRTLGTTDSFEPITINVQLPTPNTSNNNLEKLNEMQPLLDAANAASPV